MRVVVDLVGDAANGLLAESRFVARPFLPGGERNLYEFAFAAAALGFETELRGWLERAAFEGMAHDCDAAPRVNLPARLPAPEDLVVVPEGWQDPLEYGRLLLSPGRLALYLLAPPGLFGWPFSDAGWSRPDPLTVPLDAVATPAHFQAMRALGISLLTHSPGIAEAAEAAGARCAFVGTGRPAQLVSQPNRTPTVDVAALLANRWAPLVQAVVRDLDGVTIDLIGECSNEEVLARLSRARILLWPSRIEGHATIPWEARGLGCVPVALSTNRFAVGLSEASGAVIVDRVEELAPAIRALLGDQKRWRELSQRASRSAPIEVEWHRYLKRVRAFLDSVPQASPQHEAFASIGLALREWQSARAAQAQTDLEEMAAEEKRVRADRDRLEDELARAYQALEALRDRKAVRIALRLADLRRRGAP